MLKGVGMSKEFCSEKLTKAQEIKANMLCFCLVKKMINRMETT
jgi:hypothetical protein